MSTSLTSKASHLTHSFSLPPSHVPFEHPISEAGEGKAEAATLSFQDAVVYNPLRKSKATSKVSHYKAKLPKNMIVTFSKPILVQDELAEFFVTLQNPFLFELDIDSIEVV